MSQSPDSSVLTDLLSDFRNAPSRFHPTRYWKKYEQDILSTVESLDMSELRSGKYPILRTFGFSDGIYSYQDKAPGLGRSLLKAVTNVLGDNRDLAPYKVRKKDIRAMAYRHCELAAQLSGARSLADIEVSRFGNPPDIFEVNGNVYSMMFLTYYLRYCFAHSVIKLTGQERIVELGSGSGYQTEVLAKLYPEATLMCFDLPGPIYLCQHYLSQALGRDRVVGVEQTRQWQDLSGLRPGCVHLFGNWQMPVLTNQPVDVFWNAASFGEMEPEVVRDYLSYVTPQSRWIYLQQARFGKETQGRNHVEKATALADYVDMLPDYTLIDEQDGWLAHRQLSASGGYFEGVWQSRETETTPS